MFSFCRERGKSLTISIQAQPRARKTEIVGVHGDALKVKVAAPPVDGEANEELIRFFAKVLGVPKKSVQVKHGGASRQKVIEVEGVTEAQLAELLEREGHLANRTG